MSEEDEKATPESALVTTDVRDVRDGGNVEPEQQTEITRTYVEEGSVNIPLPNLRGPTGPTGPHGATGPTGFTSAFRFRGTPGDLVPPRQEPPQGAHDDIETLVHDDTDE